MHFYGQVIACSTTFCDFKGKKFKKKNSEIFFNFFFQNKISKKVSFRKFPEHFKENLCLNPSAANLGSAYKSFLGLGPLVLAVKGSGTNFFYVFDAV
jgi:hypothetical protein